jgi:transposase-like protein
VNGVKGHAALHLTRDLGCAYMTAFVLSHKIREALTLDRAEAELTGTVEIDGAYFGGHVKPENKKEDRKDRRTLETQTGKRQVVVVARERQGETLTFVVPRESAAVALIRQRVASGSIINADEASGWDVLHASYETHRVNHSVEYKAADGANTNQAESFFSRLRRSEIGIHHRISGPYLAAYASEMGWREDNRRQGKRHAVRTCRRRRARASGLPAMVRLLAKEHSRMSENEHTINALIRKRAEIAGQIESLQGQLKKAVTDLDCVEATLRLFVPTIDMAGLAPRRVPSAHHAFRGEVSRIVLEALRAATRPLTTADLAERVMRERGLDASDAALKRTMSNRVSACLRHWEKKRGAVLSMPGPGQSRMWEAVR